MALLTTIMDQQIKKSRRNNLPISLNEPEACCLGLQADTSMKQRSTNSIIALILLLPGIAEAQQTLPSHDLVGKRFVPSDVDFGRPVYEASFDDPDELKDWKLEAGDVARVTDDGNLLLKSEKHQVFWLTKQIPADFLLEFTAPYYGGYTMAFARSDEFTMRELPFVIENGSDPRAITASIEIKRGGGSIELDSVELLRLGDTRLDHRCGQNLPVDPIHGLTKLKASPKPEQTRFEKFEDTWTSAEVWLVSQGLQSRLQYPGTPNFTHDGKFFYLTTPGYVLRTDGSTRLGPFKAERIDSRYLPWPAKWMRDHLPSDRDSSDWMITDYRDNGYGLTNIVTNAKADIELPKRDGWRLVKMAPDEPGTYVNADLNLLCLWISSDRQLLAVSDSRGERFRKLNPATDSNDPTKDYLNDPFWSIDDMGRWYVSYIMNWLKLHNSFPKTPENSINPGQIWMIPVGHASSLPSSDGKPNSQAGSFRHFGKPLRVIEGLKPGIKRRVLSNGIAVRRVENMGGGHQTLSPDRELLLESFQKTSTMSVRSRKTGEVWHLGNFPYLDHPEWVWHRDFGTMRGDLRPLPLFFFDMRHSSMWPIVSMNYHDYGERLQSLRQKRGNATKKAGRKKVMRWVSWDVSELDGKSARIQIVDQLSGGWGHIVVDHIYRSNRPAPEQ